MKKPIQTTVDELIKQFAERHFSDATLLTYRKGIYGPLIKYLNESNGGFYSSELLETYLDSYRKKFETGNISRGYFFVIVRNLRILKSFAETGTADFAMANQGNKYDPGTEYCRLAISILEANNVPPGSLKNLYACARHFFCFVNEQGIGLHDVEDKTFFAFIESVSKTSMGSMRENIRTIRMISAYLRTNGIARIHTDFSMLPMKYPHIRIIPPFSQDEINRIVAAIDTSTPIGIRDYAIILLAFNTGLRGIDIIKLKLRDIDWKSGTISVKQSKTGQIVFLPLKGIVMNAIADYILKARPASNAQEVFLSSRPPMTALSTNGSLTGMLYKYCRQSDVERISRRSFHSLRRAFATELSAGGVPLGEIAEMLGHRSIRSGKPYLSYDKENILFCAGDFSDVPVKGGVYSALLAGYEEGGTYDVASR